MLHRNKIFVYCRYSQTRQTPIETCLYNSKVQSTDGESASANIMPVILNESDLAYELDDVQFMIGPDASGLQNTSDSAVIDVASTSREGTITFGKFLFLLCIVVSGVTIIYYFLLCKHVQRFLMCATNSIFLTKYFTSCVKKKDT